MRGFLRHCLKPVYGTCLSCAFHPRMLNKNKLSAMIFVSIQALLQNDQWVILALVVGLLLSSLQVAANDESFDLGSTAPG